MMRAMDAAIERQVGQYANRNRPYRHPCSSNAMCCNSDMCYSANSMEHHQAPLALGNIIVTINKIELLRMEQAMNDGYITHCVECGRELEEFEGDICEACWVVENLQLDDDPLEYEYTQSYVNRPDDYGKTY